MKEGIYNSSFSKVNLPLRRIKNKADHFVHNFFSDMERLVCVGVSYIKLSYNRHTTKTKHPSYNEYLICETSEESLYEVT